MLSTSAAQERARALANGRMFARIAHRYDLVNGLMTWGRHRAWRQAAAASARVGPGTLALDMATGTGDLALALAGHGGEVVGVDLCGPMIALGWQKARRRGLEGQVAFILGDGLHLPFGDGSFDAAATAFALRNVADVGAALGELHRVLKPQGRLACLEIVAASHRGLRLLHQLYLSTLVPLLGWAVAGDVGAYLYLRDSVRNFRTAGQLQELLRGVGFGEVRYRLYHFQSVALHTAIKVPHGGLV